MQYRTSHMDLHQSSHAEQTCMLTWVRVNVCPNPFYFGIRMTLTYFLLFYLPFNQTIWLGSICCGSSVVETLKSLSDIRSDRVTGFVRPDNSLSEQIIFTFLNKQTIYMNCKLYCFLHHTFQTLLQMILLTFHSHYQTTHFHSHSPPHSLHFHSLSSRLPHFLSLPYFFLNLSLDSSSQHLSHWHFHSLYPHLSP